MNYMAELRMPIKCFKTLGQRGEIRHGWVNEKYMENYCMSSISIYCQKFTINP